MPADEVPPEIPEPALGINFSRDGMCKKDWLSLVAVHSDCWFVAVAFYFGARLNVVTGRIAVKDNKPGADGRSKSWNSTMRSMDGQARSKHELLEESLGEVDDAENDETFCGSCGGSYNSAQFWIGCDICERWYHGKCVKITPAKAENIKQYKCPSCSTKKARHYPL